MLASQSAKERIKKQLDALKGQTDKEKMKEKAKLTKELEKQDLLAKTAELLHMAENGAYQRAWWLPLKIYSMIINIRI